MKLNRTPDSQETANVFVLTFACTFKIGPFSTDIELNGLAGLLLSHLFTIPFTPPLNYKFKTKVLVIQI
jgi:hypothetical protein